MSIALITSGHVWELTEIAQDLTIHLGNKGTKENGDWETILFGRWHSVVCGVWGAKQKSCSSISNPNLKHSNRVFTSNALSFFCGGHQERHQEHSAMCVC